MYVREKEGAREGLGRTAQRDAELVSRLLNYEAQCGTLEVNEKWTYTLHDAI